MCFLLRKKGGPERRFLASGNSSIDREEKNRGKKESISLRVNAIAWGRPKN